MNKKLGKIFPFIALLLGLVALLMMLFPVLSVGDSDTTYTGLQIITGVSVVDAGSFAGAKLPFNFLALIAFLLPILAGIVWIFMPKGYILSAILFLVAAVLFFMLPQFTYLEVTVLGSVTRPDVDWVLQSAGIVAASASILGVLVSLFGFATSK